MIKSFGDKETEKFYPMKREPTHPGVILKEEFLTPMGLTQTELSSLINSTPNTVNEIINKKRSLTTEMAIKLSKFFGTSVELWLNLQNQYDIYYTLANHSAKFSGIRPYKERKVSLNL